VIVAIVLLVVAAIGAVIFVNTDTGRAVIRDKVRDQLAKTFVGEVSIGRIEGNPLGTLTAFDVLIKDVHGQPAIAIERIETDVELLPLLRDRISMSRVCHGVVVDARREQDGTLSLAHLLTPAKSTVTIEIDELVVHGSIAITTETEPVHLDAVDLVGSLRATPDSIAATASVHATWRERSTPVRAIFAVDRHDGMLAIPSLVAHAGDASLYVANIRVDGSTLEGVGVVRAPRSDVVRLAKFDSLADLTVAFRASSGRVDDRPKPAPLATRGDPHTAKPERAETGGPSPVSGPTGIAARAPSTRLELDGTFGEAGIKGVLDVWIAARRIAGTLTGSNVDLELLSNKRVPARADGTIVVDAKLGDARLPTGEAFVTAVVHATGAYEAVPPLHIESTVASDGRRIRTRIDARNLAADAIIAADLVIDGSRIGLDGARVSASSSDLARATGGLVTARGRVELVATAHGALLPQPSLAISGRLDGRKLHTQNIDIDSARRPDRRATPSSRPLGRYGSSPMTSAPGGQLLRD
jgi:hypothetical protein